MIRLALTLWLLLTGQALAETLRLAVTTSFHNSSLSSRLLPALKEDTGIEVQLLVVGTGQALRLGRSGDVDAVLVHAEEAEKAFVAEGHAPYRRAIMYNDFILLGPAADPAGVSSAETAAQAFARIAAARDPFVSRGDDSGTHKKERALWAEAGANPEAFGSWYRSVGSGMGESLNIANAMAAYILADRASWLNFGNGDGLTLLFAGDPTLFNQYSLLPVSPERHPHVKAEAVARLEAWLTGPRAAELINSYEIAGQRLFVFNAATGAEAAD